MGALVNMGNGHLHPLNLCRGELALMSLGATIYEQSPVLKIERGTKAKVVTEHGSVTADNVALLVMLTILLSEKLRGRLFPVNSFIVASEPLSDDLVQSN